MRTNEQIVDYINIVRKQNDLSINELARKTGLAKSSLSRYFNKSRKFPLNEIDVFAEALHLKPEEILGLNPTSDNFSNINSNTYGENIRKLRSLHKITQKQLAKMLDVKPTTVASWEQGRNKPLMDKVIKLSQVLKVSPNDIMGDRFNNYVDKNTYFTPQRIRFYRIQNSLTQAQLANKLDVSEQAVYNWEHGIRTPKMFYINKMAQLFNVNSASLLAIDGQPKICDSYILGILICIPIIGTIACGTPILAEQNIDGYTTELFEEKPDGTLFALKCQGDSMEPKIPNGATVTVRLQPTVEDDEIAAVLVDDDEEATLKRVKHVGKQVMLMPENKKYDPILLNEENPGRILGKVIKVSYSL